MVSINTVLDRENPLKPRVTEPGLQDTDLLSGTYQNRV